MGYWGNNLKYKLYDPNAARYGLHILKRRYSLFIHYKLGSIISTAIWYPITLDLFSSS